MQLVLFNIDRALSGATIPGQSGPGSNGNEGVLLFPQSSSINVTSLSYCLVCLIQHTRWGGGYPSAEVQSVYCTAQADWAIDYWSFDLSDFDVEPDFVIDFDSKVWIVRLELYWSRI